MEEVPAWVGTQSGIGCQYKKSMGGYHDEQAGTPCTCMHTTLIVGTATKRDDPRQDEARDETNEAPAWPSCAWGTGIGHMHAASVSRQNHGNSHIGASTGARDRRTYPYPLWPPRPHADGDKQAAGVVPTSTDKHQRVGQTQGASILQGDPEAPLAERWRPTGGETSRISQPPGPKSKGRILREQPLPTAARAGSRAWMGAKSGPAWLTLLPTPKVSTHTRRPAPSPRLTGWRAGPAGGLAGWTSRAREEEE